MFYNFIAMKICKRCGPKDESEFRQILNKKYNKVYLFSYCRKCEYLNHRGYVATESGKEAKKRGDRKYYQNHKEDKDRKNSEYYYDHQEELMAAHREYHHANRDTILPQKREYWNENKDGFNAARRTPAHRKERNQRRANNPEKFRQRETAYYWENRDAELAKMARYRHSLRGRQTLANGKLRRLERLKHVRNDLTHDDVCELWNEQQGICLACGEPMIWEPDDRYDPMRASIDHIKPIADGGENTKDNVQLLHLICNQRKHTRTIDYRETPR